MKQTNILSTVLLTCSLVLAGCGSNPSQDDQPPKAKHSLFVTGGDESYDTAVARSEVTLLSPHKALLHLAPLKPGRVYDMRWRLCDTDGNVLFATNKTHVGTDSDHYFWRVFEPDYKRHKPGKWNWSVEVSGVGQFSAEFMVLPPTPSDLQNLANYEQAREEVFRVFARSWLGFNGDYFTAVTWRGKDGDYDNVLQLKPERVKISLAHHTSNTNLLVERNFNGLAEPAKPESMLAQALRNVLNNSGAQALAKTNSLNDDVSLNLLQVKELAFSFSSDCVSEADALNGISYKGHAEFGFRTYRRWTSPDGWSEWKDTESYGSMFGAAFSRFWSPHVPVGFNDGFQLRYSFEKKDGHWRITVDNRELYVNGKHAGRTPHESTTGVAESNNQVWQPTLQVVESLAKGLGHKRISDSITGDQCRATPEEIARNSITTMTMLRGRPL